MGASLIPNAFRSLRGGEVEEGSLASFRATPRQALGRGAHLASWGAGVLGVLSCLIGTGVGVARPGLSGSAAGRWILATLAVLALIVVIGALAGLLSCRYVGIDVDEVGLRQRPTRRGGLHRWRDVADLRAERHGGNLEVRAYLERGGFVRLSAPYHGRLLARDFEFEHKYLILRQEWEAHRRWGSSKRR
jgi:hypothetical protein